LSDSTALLESPSTIRSQNFAASDDQNPSTSVAADYSPLQASPGPADSSAVSGNTTSGVVPVYASGHSFVPRRARLGKPIPLPDNAETPSTSGKNPTIDGSTISQTTAGNQHSAQEQNSVNPTETVPTRPSEVSFGKAGWQGIWNPGATDRSAKNTASDKENGKEEFAPNGGWNGESGPSPQQNDPAVKLITKHRSGGKSSPDVPPPTVESGPQPDEDSTTDAAADDTTADTDTDTAKEPTVLDKLRGLYPRRDEALSKRSRKSKPLWSNPFGLLRDPEEETADATLGATTPLVAPTESATDAVETTDAAQGSETLLEPLIVQVEQELAQWPMLPDGKPRNELEWRRRQTDLRMLYLIAGRSAESIRVIEALPEKEQEFWQSMMLAMESYRRSDDSAARAEQLTETLEYVRNASRQLQPLSTMKIRKLNFCNRIDGFGSFSVFPTSEFNAGQPLLLYAEIENYKSELTSDGQYRSEFAARIEFFRDGEAEPIASRTIRLPEIEDLCSTERTDYFQSYELTVPTLSPGKYRLRLHVRDQLSLQIATTELPFDIRPLGNQQ
jgi:hypothetical protein